MNVYWLGIKKTNNKEIKKCMTINLWGKTCNGKYALSGANDNTLKLWQIQSGNK